MKLARSTWVKIGLIALLCVLVCSAAGGCARWNWRSGLFPSFPAGGVLGCMAMPMTSVFDEGIIKAPEAPNAPDAPDAPEAPTVPSIGELNAWGQGSFSVYGDLVNAIELNWLAGKVNVEVVSVDEPTYTITATETISGNAPDLFWELHDNGTLEINYMEGNQNFLESLFTGGWSGSKELTLQIPETLAVDENQLDRLEVEAASGTYNIKGMDGREYFTNMSFNIASGEVSVEKVELKNLEVSLASGRFNFNGGVNTNAKIDQASGESRMNLTPACPSTLTASLASGSLDITVPEGTLIYDNVSKTSGNYDNSVPTPEGGSDEVCNFTLDMVSGNCVVHTEG